MHNFTAPAKNSHSVPEPKFGNTQCMWYAKREWSINLIGHPMCSVLLSSWNSLWVVSLPLW